MIVLMLSDGSRAQDNNLRQESLRPFWLHMYLHEAGNLQRNDVPMTMEFHNKSEQMTVSPKSALNALLLSFYPLFCSWLHCGFHDSLCFPRW